MIFEFQPGPLPEKPAQSAEALPWRILLVDDDEDDYLITRSHLSSARGRIIDLDWAVDFDEGLARLREHPYDAVLVDYDLGTETGLAFIRRASRENTHTPLILYTGRGGYTVDLEAMEVGATLYLTKVETNPLLLERSIRYAIERKQAERALLESEERYRTLFAHLEGLVQARTAELHEAKELFERMFQAAPYATLLVRPDGRIRRANAQAAQLFGYHEHEIVGSSIEMLLPERQRQAHAHHRAGYLRWPSIRRMSTRAGICGLHKNGQEFRVDVMLGPVEINGEVNIICMVREPS